MTRPYAPATQSKPDWGPLYRSCGEADVADALSRLGINYVYEPRLELSGLDPSHVEYARPDFMLSINRPVVIEYAGMLDQPDYRARHQAKAELYAANGIKLIEIKPDDLRAPDWERSLLEQIIQACM